MASAVSALTGSSASSSAATSAALGGAPAPTEEMFLQLLVAQLQNQDPLNPTDSTQFVSQLAQFSELEQVMGIRSDIETYAAKADSSQSSTSTTPATATTQS
jgi:flagellar basal-body rod modification protein FlgD